MIWDDFLCRMAIDYSLTPDQSQIFCKRFSETFKNKKESDFFKVVSEQLSMNTQNYKRLLTEIYKKFTPTKHNPNGCAALQHHAPGKSEKLRQWLEQRYLEQMTERQSEELFCSTLKTDWNHICDQMLQLKQSCTLQKSQHQKNVYVPAKLVPHNQALKTIEPGKDPEEKYFSEQIIPQHPLITQNPKNIAILGASGTGKTTWLWQLASVIKKLGIGYPIYISLANLQQKSLCNYLLQNWLEDALPFMNNELEVNLALKTQLVELFNSGQVWLLIDAVEKLNNLKTKFPLSILGHQLINYIAKANIVLACPTEIWEADGASLSHLNFETYQTLAFDEQQIENFIEQWFSNNKQELGKELLNKLSQTKNERIENLIKNPSSLAKLCKNWEMKKDNFFTNSMKLPDKFKDYYSYWRFIIFEK